MVSPLISYLPMVPADMPPGRGAAPRPAARRAATPLQFAAQVIDMLHRWQPDSPTLWSFSRILLCEPDARRAEKALRCLRERKSGGRSGHAEGGLGTVFRWFSGAQRGAELAAAAGRRYRQLLAGPLDEISPMLEAAICLHLAMSQGGEAGRDGRDLAEVTFAALAAAPASARGRLLRGLVLHLCTDAGLDLAPWLLRHRQVYEPADLVFALGRVAVACPRSAADAALVEIIGDIAADRAVLGLCAAHLCLRLGTGGAIAAAARYLQRMQEQWGEGLRSVPAAGFVAYAERWDYGRDLARIVGAHGADFPMDTFIAGALRWLEPRRRRALPAGRFGPAQYAAATRRFAGWSFSHALCRPLFGALSVLDEAGWRAIGALAERGQELPLLPEVDELLTGWLRDAGPDC